MTTLLKPLPMKPFSLDTVANGILFNISWLAIVGTHSPLIAPAVVATHLIVHFAFSGRGLPEAKLVLAVTVVGFLLDWLLFSTGVFTISGATASAPLWISCLWPVLATTLMHAFRGLQQRPWLASAIGAIGGTGSYLAGTRMTDVEFASLFWGPVIIAITWALVFPLLLSAARSAMTTETRYDVV